MRFGGMGLTDYGFYVLCATAVVLLATQAVTHPTDFLQVTVFGLTQGAIYALVALGYTMVYGIIELINFAHGMCLRCPPTSEPPSSLLRGHRGQFHHAQPARFAGRLPGCDADHGRDQRRDREGRYRPLRNAPRLAPLITAIGMSFFLEGIMFFWKGPATVHFPDILPQSSWLVGGVFFGVKDVFVIVTAAIL